MSGAAPAIRVPFARVPPRTKTLIDRSPAQRGLPSPAALLRWLRSRRRSDFTVLPGGPQTGQKFLNRRRRDLEGYARAVRNIDEMLLRRSHFAQKANRVEGRLQASIDRALPPGFADRPETAGRAWPAHDSVSSPGRRRVLFRQLERGLEKVHEQPDRPIKTSEGCGRLTLQAADSQQCGGQLSRFSVRPRPDRSCDRGDSA